MATQMVLRLVSFVAFACAVEEAPPEILPPAWPVIVESLSRPEPCLHLAQDGDTLTIEYVGRLTNGTVITSSAQKPVENAIQTCEYYGKPFTFVLGRGQAIRGVDMGLVGMCFQERTRLTIPSHLAYGASGTGNIPGDADLIFDYELIKIVPRFHTSTISEPHLCTHTAGIGSHLTVDYSMHYSIFDSSLKQNHYQIPLENTFGTQSQWSFTLSADNKRSNLIQGLRQGLDNICLNETRTLVVPPWLAYGDAGISGYIPGGATVYFNVSVHAMKYPRFEITVNSQPGDGCRELEDGDTLGIHYTSVVTNGRYKLKRDPEMMETTRLNGKGPWMFEYSRDADIVEGLYQGLKKICVGEKRTLRIPPEMAWGNGIEGYIRGDATVVFEVEALSIA